MSNKTATSTAPRNDKRYKDQKNAPKIVSEKRLTFFLSNELFKSMMITAGKCQVANAEAKEGTDLLPDTPSALVREALDYFMDTLRPANERTRKGEEWDKRVAAIKKAFSK